MNKLDIYTVYYMDYNDKDGVMKYEATGSVKSEKYFPVYVDYIFKPLSRTKPLTTPLFAYSEVFWSYFIQKYFEENAPRYYLAECSNIDKYIPKYYPIGTLVKKVTNRKQKLVNLLEYFNLHQEEGVDIGGYVNFCEKLYDYTEILDAPIFKKRVDLRHKLENQILLSILKEDENFHYENVSFIEEDGNIIDLCPTLDSEFSSFFLYPEKTEMRDFRKLVLRESLDIPFALPEDKEEKTKKLLRIQLMTSLINIIAILIKDPEVVISFSKKIDDLIGEIEAIDEVYTNYDFFKFLNSDSWKIGAARFKNNNENGAILLEKSILGLKLDSAAFNERLKTDLLDSFKNLKFNLEVLITLYHNNCLVPGSSLIKYLTVKQALEIKGICISEDEYKNLTVDDKLKLINSKEKQKTMI